jgi:two-component system KDP operon response regulator KdpE
MTTAMFRILVVEDDDELRSMLCTLLESQSYRVSEAASGQRGILEARSYRPDLVLVDLGLPDLDGTDVVRAIRSFAAQPILVLTARTMEADKVLALDAGADDYVTKPFSTSELLARIRAALRRTNRAGAALPVLELGTVRLDFGARTATGPEGPIHLTPLEYRLIECLARSAGMIVTQRQLLREVWGPERVSDSRGLRSYIKFLRQKLEPDPGRPRFILTEAGVGYRLQLDETVADRSLRPSSPSG